MTGFQETHSGELLSPEGFNYDYPVIPMNL